MRAKLVNSLFEKAIEDINVKDIVTKQYIDEQHQKDFLGPFVAQYLQEENGEYFNWDDDEEKTDEIINDSDFKNWLEYELEVRFDDFRDTINDLTNYSESRLILYRAMSVPADYLDKMIFGKVKRLGHYWAYSKEKAEPHWGYNDEKLNHSIIFEIKIPDDQVDWIETFRLNLEHDFYNDESEIRLFKNTPINIENISWDEADVEDDILSKIKSFNYKA